jgi:hypothetical protein
MIDQFDVTIDNVDYKITQFAATEGLRIKAELLRLCGDALSVAFITNEKGESELNIGAIVASIVENLDKVDVAALLRKLMSRVTKGAYAIDFDQEFAGNYSALYSLVVEVLKVNYGDVLKKLGIGGQAQNQG